jgi:hypothetical protein
MKGPGERADGSPPRHRPSSPKFVRTSEGEWASGRSLGRVAVSEVGPPTGDDGQGAIHAAQPVGQSGRPVATAKSGSTAAPLGRTAAARSRARRHSESSPVNSGSHRGARCDQIPHNLPGAAFVEVVTPPPGPPFRAESAAGISCRARQENHQRRSVPLPRFLADELAEHLVGKKPDDLVFTSPAGGVLRNTTSGPGSPIPRASESAWRD